MGFYSPPACGEIKFIITLRVPLDPCNLVFDLLEGKENNVEIPDSVISITSDVPVVFDNEPVITGSTTFKIISGDCAVFSANAAIMRDTTFKIISDDLEVENKDAILFEQSTIVVSTDMPVGIDVLPSVKVEDSRILVLSDDSLIKVWPSVITYDSNIQIIADPTSSIRNPDASDLPKDVTTAEEGGDGASQVWRGFIDKKDPIIQVLWDKEEDIPANKQIIFTTQKKVESSTSVPWRIYKHYQTLRQVIWQEYTHKLDVCSTIPWGVFELPDPVNPDARHTWSIMNHVGWASLYNSDLFELIPWYAPGPKDVPKDILWRDFDIKDVEYKVSWHIPGAVDPEIVIPWGPIDWTDICCQRYWPPKPCTSIRFEIHEPVISGVCSDIVFSIGPGYGSHLGQFCPYQHRHSGRRDPFDPIGQEDNIERLKTKDEYDMSNVVSVYLIKGELQPIEVTSISIRTDKQSYLWDFSLTIGKDDFSTNFLEELKPQWDGEKWVYPELLIMVNFNYWVCTVEGYQESRTFGKDTWQISGRSPSMLLGSPVCKKFNYSYSDSDPYNYGVAISGAQIIDKVLKGEGIGINDTLWRASFDRYEERNPTRTSFGFDPSSADDWGFYPGTITFQDSTQIDIVSSLASSIGAFIITEPCPYKNVIEREDTNNSQRKLYIRPYYGFPPWHWLPGTTNWFAVWGDNEQRLSGVKLLHTDLALDVGRSNELKSEYNAVMVMGTISSQNAGFPVVDMYRKGFSGERIYAPDVTDEKLQTWKACAEIGRKVLSETGFWIKHTLKMYSLAAPSGTPGHRPHEPELPGLCWPGDFVQVQERQGRTGARVWYGDVEAVQIDVAVNNNVVYVSQTLGINEYAEKEVAV